VRPSRRRIQVVARGIGFGEAATPARELAGLLPQRAPILAEGTPVAAEFNLPQYTAAQI
jgi:hypothetical protein